jgi:hypothetical protein
LKYRPYHSRCQNRLVTWRVVGQPENYPETGLAEMSGDFLEADFALPIWQVTWLKLNCQG